MGENKVFSLFSKISPTVFNMGVNSWIQHNFIYSIHYNETKIVSQQMIVLLSFQSMQFLIMAVTDHFY